MARFFLQLRLPVLFFLESFPIPSDNLSGSCHSLWDFAFSYEDKPDPRPDTFFFIQHYIEKCTDCKEKITVFWFFDGKPSDQNDRVSGADLKKGAWRDRVGEGEMKNKRSADKSRPPQSTAETGGTENGI